MVLIWLAADSVFAWSCQSRKSTGMSVTGRSQHLRNVRVGGEGLPDAEIPMSVLELVFKDWL